MIPLRDTIKSKTFPFVTVSIIVVNVLIFLGELTLNQDQLTALFYQYGAVPSWIVGNFLAGNYLTAIVPMITATFLHGGWLHIISNMLFLWVFGDNVEDKLGHFKYFLFYIAVGFIGNLAQILLSVDTTVPIIGASGAVAGILGAYYMKFPHSRIIALIPLVFIFTLTEVKASIFIFFWFILQLFNGALSLGAMGNSVAYWAHIGGFSGGIILLKIFTKKDDIINLK